jgi:protease-4
VSTGKRLLLAAGLILTLAVVVIGLTILAGGVLRNGLPLLGQRVALLRVEGMIRDTERMVDLARDASVRAIVVRIESGGGAVGSSQELYGELLRARGEKPIVISCGNVCASGGYYIALAGDRIFVNPGTITGSIGVLMNHVDTSGLLRDRLGLDFTEVASRDNKDVASIHEPLTDADRVLLEGMLDEVHGQFVGAVRANRGEAIRAALAAAAELEPQDIDDAAVEELLATQCDGRPMTGTRALELGFADELGNLPDAILAAARMAGIEGEPHVIEWRPRQTLFGPAVSGAVDEVRAALREELRAGAPVRYEMPGL